MKELQHFAAAVFSWMCVTGGEAFLVASTPPPLSNNLHKTIRRKGQKRPLAAAWHTDWGLNWNRLNHNPKLATPDDDEDAEDRTIRGLEKMQTEIGALIAELQSRHDSNGKEAALQAKLAALSTDLEAYRAESELQRRRKRKSNVNGESLKDDGINGMLQDASVNGLSKKKSETKSSPNTPKHEKRAGAKHDEKSIAPDMESSKVVCDYHFADITSSKIKTNGAVDERDEWIAGVGEKKPTSQKQSRRDRRMAKKITKLSSEKQEKGKEVSNGVNNLTDTEDAPSAKDRRQLPKQKDETKKRVDPIMKDVKTMNATIPSNETDPQGFERKTLRKMQQAEQSQDMLAFNDAPELVVGPSDEQSEIVASFAEPARKDRLKNRVEEARIRASARAAKKQTSFSSMDIDEEDFRIDANAYELPQSTARDEGRYRDTSISPYIIEIQDDTIENLASKSGNTPSSKRFGEPPSLDETTRIGPKSRPRRRVEEQSVPMSKESSTFMESSTSSSQIFDMKDYNFDKIWESFKSPEAPEPPRSMDNRQNSWEEVKQPDSTEPLRSVENRQSTWESAKQPDPREPRRSVENRQRNWGSVKPPDVPEPLRSVDDRQRTWESVKPPDMPEPPRYRRFGDPPMNMGKARPEMHQERTDNQFSEDFFDPTGTTEALWTASPPPRRFGEPPMRMYGSDRKQQNVWKPAQDWLEDHPQERFSQPPMPDAFDFESPEPSRQVPTSPPRSWIPPIPSSFGDESPEKKWYEPTEPAPPPQEQQPFRQQPEIHWPPPSFESQISNEAFGKQMMMQSNKATPRKSGFQSRSRQDTFEQHPWEIDASIPRPQGEAPMARTDIEDLFDSATEKKHKDSQFAKDETATLEEAPLCIWDTPYPISIEGSELRTWSFDDDSIERVQVFLKAEGGKPLQASVDLWHGPDDTPQKMTVFLANGSTNPFSAVIETPVGHNSVAIQNTADVGQSLRAAVVASDFGNGSHGFGPLAGVLSQMERPEKELDGGQSKTWPLSDNVSSVQVLLRAYKRPLHARVELLQESDKASQRIDIYTEDGFERPFFVVIETPGEGNVVRVVNTAFEGFPMEAIVEPDMIDAFAPEDESS